MPASGRYNRTRYGLGSLAMSSHRRANQLRTGEFRADIAIFAVRVQYQRISRQNPGKGPWRVKKRSTCSDERRA
eukprot:scaffold38847_cov17-Prasinocladus_malaysianus.AAC.1